LLAPFFIDRNAPRMRGFSETPEFARPSFNAIGYLLKTGCQWRMLPKEYPSRTTVHDAFTRWTKSGLWERINSALREKRRIGVKKTPLPAPRSSTAKA
jgi:transposase